MERDSLNRNGLNILGVIFILLWILTFFEEFPYFGSLNFIWLCKISFLFLGLGCLLKDSGYVSGFLAAGFAVEMLWIIDYISLLFNHPLVGFTSFMFEYGETKFQFVMNLLHLFIIPSFLYVMTKFNKFESAKKKILIYSALIVVLAYLFSEVNTDVNCTKNLCYPRPLGFEYIPIIIVCSYVLISAFIFEPIMRKIANSIAKDKTKKRLVNFLIIFLILVGIFGFVYGIIKYSSTPHYKCVSNEEFRCERFFMDRINNQPFLQYSIKVNEEAKDDSIYLKWIINDKEYQKERIDLTNTKHLTKYLPNFNFGTRKVSVIIEIS